MSNSFGDFEELKETKELYIKNLDADADKNGYMKYPCLKYALYNWNLLLTFDDRIDKIKNDIKELKEKLNDYKGNKVNANKEIEKLDENTNKLLSIQKEAKEGYEYYKHYLIKLAKKSDELNNETAKSIYINTSEEIKKNLN